MTRKSLIFLVLIIIISCKGPTGPSPIDDPWKYGGEIEIMYVRVLPVVNPSGTDPTNWANILHPKYGGKESSRWVPAGDGAWISTISLNCDPQPYTISTGDGKVSLHPVGEKFLLRLKKEGASWVEITCIIMHPLDPAGKAAKFIFYNGQIQNAHPCS